MQIVAVNWQIYVLLKGSSFAIDVLGQHIPLDAKALGLGTLGLVRIVPIIAFALFGGMIADTQDRRKVMIWAQVLSAVFAGILGAITLAGAPSVAAIYLLTATGSAITAFGNPAQQSLVPHLVPREVLTNAISLNTLLMQITSIMGPALAGVLIGSIDIGWIYILNALSFGVVVAALLMMQYRGRAAASNTGIGWKPLAEGLRFTYHSRIIWSTMLLDFVATFFSSARTMLPILASDILHVGVAGYGLLSTAQSVGAVVAGSITALRRDIHRQGIVLLVSVAIYGAATALFGITTNFALSYFFFALTGAADTVSTVIRGTLRQLLTPDALRGRMVSVNMIFFMGGPQLGELEAGVVAAAFGTPFSIVSGGVITVLMAAWVAWRYAQLRNFTSDAYAT